MSKTKTKRKLPHRAVQGHSQVYMKNDCGIDLCDARMIASPDVAGTAAPRARFFLNAFLFPLRCG